MTDVFISYSRTDVEFVQRIASSLEVHGKSAWVDTEGISDAEVFPRAIRSAIEESDAFLFVITPASVASGYCEQEVTYASTLAKRIVPVLRDAVPDTGLPEDIRDRNWIPFSEGDDYEDSVGRLVQALDTDLDLRRYHTRLLVKALEWDRENRARTLLLRGAQLKAAEAWLGRSGIDTDPTPTALQRDYVLTSRRATSRQGRIVVGTSVTIAVIALGLGVLALLSRNQAVSSANGSRAVALAAESQNELTVDPEVSVVLAREAVSLMPIPQAVAALRQAMDASAVRVSLPSVAPEQCGFESGPSIGYSPNGRRVAESLCNGDVVVMNSATGKALFRRHVAAQATAIAYEPNGELLAVGTNRGIDLVDPDTGLLRRQLVGHGEPNALAFNHSGTLLAATTNLGTTEWDLNSSKPLFSLSDPDEDRTLAYTSNGRVLIVGTGHAYTEVIDADTGEIDRLLVPPGYPFPQKIVDPIALEGSTLVVGTGTQGPQDEDGIVYRWNTNTWSMAGTWTTVNGFSFADLALSPDGQRLAYGLDDGTGGVWGFPTSYGNGSAQELSVLEGQTAAVNTIRFSPDSQHVVDADDDGTARIYDAGEPWQASVPATPEECGDQYAVPPAQYGWQHDDLVAIVESGNDTMLRTWALPGGRPLPGSVLLSSDGLDTCASLSPDGRLVALWDDRASPAGEASTTRVKVLEVSSGRVLRTMPAMPVDGVVFSRDGRLLVVNDGHGGLHTTILSDGRTSVTHGWPVQCAAATGEYAPSDVVVTDNDRLEAVSNFCGVVRFGHTGSGPFETFEADEKIDGITFNPAGTELALAEFESSVTVLNVARDKPALELLGHTRQITGVAFSPVGNLIATTSFDNTLRVWNATTGQLLRIDHDDSFTAVTLFSPDGRLVTELELSGYLHVWSACPDCTDPSALLAASRSSIVTLSPVERAEVSARA
jgi:WD40 repeat protein